MVAVGKSKIQITSGLADGTEAGLEGVPYFTENFIQGSSPFARQRGEGGADYFDCCEKLVQTDPRAPWVW